MSRSVDANVIAIQNVEGYAQLPTSRSHPMSAVTSKCRRLLPLSALPVTSASIRTMPISIPRLGLDFLQRWPNEICAFVARCDREQKLLLQWLGLTVRERLRPPAWDRGNGLSVSSIKFILIRLNGFSTPGCRRVFPVATCSNKFL